MNTDVKRLIKIETRIREVATEMGIEFGDVEFDIVPPEKFFEIMAYNIPTNISNWKYGRNYERIRTIYENMGTGLPYEVVINGDPARAYLMNTNPLPVQALVMAHVYGHIAVYKMNQWFSEVKGNIVNFMQGSYQRFNEYERRFGIDEVEKTIDAGHALQLHCEPFDNETEEEKKKRVFEQRKKIIQPSKSEYADLTSSYVDNDKERMSVELFNQKLWKKMKDTIPIEPTEDILRFLIDNSNQLEDWQKDILEVLRTEGQYYWPIIKSKFLNEGFATWTHQKIINVLFKEGYLKTEEHGTYNYSNSLVKAEHKTKMNPYVIGCTMWEDVERRWDMGQHGTDWNNCDDYEEKKNWDTGDMKGVEKVLSSVRTFTDWMFMQNFLTIDLVERMNLYIYAPREAPGMTEWVRTKHTAEEVKKLIVNSFAHSGIPKIMVEDGKYRDKGDLLLKHDHAGINLDKQYCVETLRHICFLWGRDVLLKTKYDGNEKLLEIKMK